jgi:hypothetical protein
MAMRYLPLELPRRPNFLLIIPCAAGNQSAGPSPRKPMNHNVIASALKSPENLTLCASHRTRDEEVREHGQ